MTVSATVRLSPVNVALGEIKYSQNPYEVLTAYGLGSGVGIAIWDSSTSLTALAHIILPTDVSGSRTDDRPQKYADRAIPAMVNELMRLGADTSCFVVRIAGGAQMLQRGIDNDFFNTGTRNVEQVRCELARAGLRIAGEHVLGHHGRTLSVCPRDGRVTVQTAGIAIEL